MLFYCPNDSRHPEIGTSIYIPKDPNFTCEGGPHYLFDGFQKVTTTPFVPNSVFCFLKTKTGFHGVEPVAEADTSRDLILYDIRIENIEWKKVKNKPFSDKILKKLIKVMT
jgi:hypothetical protein